MAIGVDPSSPPRADGASASSTATTASFTAPAGSVLVACVVANSSTGGTTTDTVTDSSGLTWTRRTVANFAATGRSGFSSIWTAVAATAVSRTVTVTTAGSTSTTRRPSLKVYVLTGVDTSNVFVSASIGGSSSFNSLTLTSTSTVDNSWVFVAASDWNKLGVPSSDDLTADCFDQVGTDGVSGLFGYKNYETAGSESVNANAFGPSAPAVWNIALLVMRPAPEPTTGVPLLPNELSGARLEVSVAWGADLTQPSNTWLWTDITTDVRQQPGINVSLGRSDEASTSQPAQCTLTLDNTGGKYSLGGVSPNYPYVRRGTPVRVRVRPSSGTPYYTTVFQGNAVSWKPDWNLKGNVPVVELEAAGALRRMMQGAAPVESPVRRYVRTLPYTVAYWPMEEESQAQQFESVVSNGLPMTWNGTPKLSSNSDFPASRSIPVLNTAQFNGPVTAYAPSSDFSQSVRFLAAWPATGTNASSFAQLVKIYFSGGTTGSLVLYYAAGFGGALGLRAYAYDGTLLYDTGTVGFSVDDGKFWYSIEMFQSGGVVHVGLNQMRLGENLYVLIAGDPNYSGSIGTIRSVQVNPVFEHPQVAVGHVAVLNVRSSTVGTELFDAYPQMNGYPGENATTRFTRLVNENGIPALIESPLGDGSSQASKTMGPQEISDPISLLRSAEKVGRGLMFDGLGGGLYYKTSRQIECQAPVLTINAASLQLANGFQPVDNDQRLVNLAAVTRSGAGTQTFEDKTGPLGSEVVGEYQVTDTVNVDTDQGAALHAAWLVARGTVEGYRYPTLPINLRSTPSLAVDWLKVIPGTRIDVTGLQSVLPTHNVDTLSLLVEGVSHTFSNGEWSGVAKCSPYAVWNVGTVGATTYTGDTAFTLKADGEGTTTSTINPASTSVTVSVPSGLPLWITTSAFPNEFPLDLEIGGRKVTATGISGSSSPQTFTITPTGFTIPAGAAVKLWQPQRLGI